jgi:hypothetical protein
MSRAMTVFPPAALALCMGQIGTGGPVHGKASAGSNLGPPEVHARYISSLTCKYPPAGRTRSRPTANGARAAMRAGGAGLERGLDGGGDELRGLRVDGDVAAEQHAADDLPGVPGRVVRVGGHVSPLS